MGTHGHRGLGHFLLGSVAEEIIRLARCPVLTVRERKEPRPRTDVSQVLVPVDFSEHSRTALTYAKEITQTYDAHLQLLHVIETPVFPSFYGTTGATLMEMSASIASQAKAQLESFMAKAKGPEVPGDLHVIEGHSGTDIVKFADRHSTDLIVIAIRGLSEIEELLVGSTTEKVVRRAACPVLTINAGGKSLVDS
jgi:nucleotide-binding universal stress UspA family protein